MPGRSRSPDATGAVATFCGPSVSVVLPVFDRQRQGERALASALNQTHSDIEVIVVDDGSPVPFFLPSVWADDERVRLIRHETNAGAASARNTGIAVANGEWIAFLDSDDFWHPEKLARQLEQASGQASKLICYVTGFSLRNAATGCVRNIIPIESRNSTDFAAGCWFAPGSTAMIPRAAFVALGKMDGELRRLEDLDWFLRFGEAGGILKVLQSVEVTVETGHKPSISAVDDAATLLANKWLSYKNGLQKHSRSHLRGYLALERAAARLHGHDWGGGLIWMAISFLARPRLSLHLRRWWRRV